MQKTYSVLIAEDEPLAREFLIEKIAAHKELKLSAIAKNGQEALSKLKENKFDLVFLDINLPFLSGIEVLEKLDNFPYIIFSTAYDNYAVKAFDFGAIDYLLKPYSKERFDQAVDKFISINNKNQNNQSLQKIGLSFRIKDTFYLIAYQDIIYISSHGKHTVIHSTKSDFEIANLLKDIEAKLPMDIFSRIHKQFIVNLKFISHIKHIIGIRYSLHLKDEDETNLPIGIKYKDSLKEKLAMEFK